MNKKHTAAPWELYEDEHQTAITVDNCSLAVAFLPTLLKDTEANKHLIKYAPDMLAMLQELMSHKTFASHLPTTALKVQALIKKATGD